MFKDILFLLDTQDNKKAKGDFLENVASNIIKKSGYDVIERVRFTGMEIDVIGIQKLNKHKVYVECKFHKKPISAPDIFKLIGKCSTKKITEAIFIYTSSFGMEAKGIKIENEEDDSPNVKVFFWGKKEILEGLVNAYSEIISKLESKFGNKLLNSATFCLREKGDPFFLIEESMDDNSSKLRILDLNYINKEQDKIISLLKKQPEFDGKYIYFNKKSMSSEINGKYIADVVAPIIPEDDIYDYRPSDPKNFIGRINLLRDFHNFFIDVQKNQTKTRIICLEGPTGYGKSSFLLKLIDKISKTAKKNLFLYAVDCRSANTGQFVSLSLKKIINTAVKSSFLPKEFSKNFLISSTEYLSSEYMVKLSEFLHNKNKVLILFFDQFEEILTKNSLNSVFINLQQLFNEITANEINIIIGFSWREHIYFQETNEAYHLFRNTEDKRKTFKISDFKQKDVSSLIKLFEKKKNKKISNPIKRRIEMQAQGLPWWTKKLCIHIFSELEKTGHHQLLAQNLNIKTLFDNDLNKLSDREEECLRYIAKHSPVSSSEILEHYEEKIITVLQKQRQIIKVGLNFTIYWDIFKEYLLSDHVPTIPFASIPQCEIKMLLKTLSGFVPKKRITKNNISSNTKYSDKTSQNIIADLLTLDIIEEEKSKYVLNRSLNIMSDKAISDHLKEILNQHTLVINLRKVLKKNKSISINEIEELIVASNPSVILIKKTVVTYAKRFVRYLIFSGLLEEKGKDYILNLSGDVDFSSYYLINKKGVGIISGSPQKAYNICLKLLDSGEFNRNEGKVRNTISDLSHLGLIDLSRNVVKPSSIFFDMILSEDSIKVGFKSVLLKNEYLNSIATYFLKGAVTNSEIYTLIKDKFSLNWSKSSIKRNITTAKRWLRYYGIITKVPEEENHI